MNPDSYELKENHIFYIINDKFFMIIQIICEKITLL